MTGNRGDSTNPLRDAAESYGNLGWPVFPVHTVANGTCSCGKPECESPAKHPRTRNGLKDATVDARRIQAWWRRYRQFNIGIRTGEISGIIVLDVDPRHGGDGSLEALIAKHGPFPPTVESQTGGGGQHFLFRHPGGEVRNRANLCSGLDLRGDGGYIVAPPSMHISGQCYEWKDGRGPGEIELAELPDWLLELLNSSAAHARTQRPTADSTFSSLLEAAMRYVAKTSAAAAGSRNSAAFNLAGHLAAFQTQNNERLGKQEIICLMSRWNDGNQPPLAEAELLRTIESALQNGTPREPHLVKAGVFKINQSVGSNQPDCDDLPVAILPGGSHRVLDASAQFGGLLAATGCHFLRGGVVTKVTREKSGARRMQPLKPAAMPGELEKVAQLVKISKKEGEEELVPTICNEQTAKILLHAEPFQSALPPINVVSRCPVLIERDGFLVQVSDYDPDSGILAEGETIPDLELSEARRLLVETLADFRFASEGDRSRALAALITPALVLGGLLKGRAAVDLSEADQSQAGKGFRNKITAAIYREHVKTITQRRGGVGSLEETFNAAVISGAPFISLDNIRGKIDSPAIESYLTETEYQARIPYSPSVTVDPLRTIVMITSNKAEMTGDLANRCSCVRILKQPPGYDFKKFASGDILDHVKRNQPRYLGAVFSLIRAWHKAGSPQSSETRHDFRRWARTLDCIVQNLFGAAPLMDGHQQTKQRMTNPALTWLRDVALAVEKANETGVWLRAHHLVEILEACGVEIPGVGDNESLEDEATREKALRGLGKRLASCFGPSGTELELDHLAVIRRESVDTAGRDRREYLFRPIYRTESPAFPHTPHGDSTFFSAGSERPTTSPQDSKSSNVRGECGAMREPFDDVDEVNFKLAVATDADCENGQDVAGHPWLENGLASQELVSPPRGDSPMQNDAKRSTLFPNDDHDANDAVAGPSCPPQESNTIAWEEGEL